jgi:hypothetical protein
MTISRAEIALALAATLFAGAAAAQSPEAKPASSPPQGLAGSPSPPPSDFHDTRVSAPIEVNALGSPDGPPAGLFDPTNGGLAGDIWSGSDRATIEAMLARVPLATPVYAVRSLARRLVLTVADAPVGQAPHAFQTVRLRALLSAGLVAEAAKLAMQVQLKDDPEFARVQAEAILLGGTAADACSNATAARETNTEPFWLQLRAYCYGAGGQKDLFDLTRGVMKAEGSDDRAFAVLLDDALAHKTLPPGEMHDPTAVELFLLWQVGLPVSTAFAARFGEAASVVALHDAKNTPMVRADAAAQALHTGWLSSTDLGAVADAQVFTPQQLANAENAAVGLPFFLGQALIRQAVAQAPDDEAKARLLSVALRAGRQMQALAVSVRMQQTALAPIAPGPRFHAYVATFARALLLARQPDAAERWRESLDAGSDADHPLSAALAVELNLVAPNPGRAQRAQAALTWLAQNAASLQPQDGPDEARYDAVAVAVCDALGEALPPGVSTAPILAQKWPGRVIPPAMRKKLDELRGQETRKGEALLTILDMVGALGPGDLSPDAAAYVVRYLKSEGETDAARLFAIDALLLYQPQS